MRIVIVAVLLLCFGAPAGAEDEYETVLRSYAGKDAVDCGYAGPNDDRTAVDDCTVKAFRDATPFIALFGELHVDSVFHQGIASTPNGNVYFVKFVKPPLPDLCVTPVVEEIEGHPRIACRKLER